MSSASRLSEPSTTALPVAADWVEGRLQRLEPEVPCYRKHIASEYEAGFLQFDINLPRLLKHSVLEDDAGYSL